MFKAWRSLINIPDKIKADRPFQIVQIDYIGPLPISETKLYVQAPV